MFDLFAIFGRNELDAWRDEYSLTAAAVLNQAAADLIASVEPLYAQASWKEGLIAPSSFIQMRVAPIVRAATEPIVASLFDEANRALGRIVAHQAVWHDRAGSPAAAADRFDGWQDVAFAAAPLAGGAALAVALPAAAAATTTAWFGLVTVTSISWPVVVGGGALAGVAVATGMLNTARIWSKAEARLRRKVHAFVVAALIRGPGGRPAVLEQVVDILGQAGREAKTL